ncbi:MAG: DUF167 domain-containing protein [Phycisphaerales bacterium]|nr:DUF167 domain-containing protein [Phycisphaerales bacterium]
MRLRHGYVVRQEAHEAQARNRLFQSGGFGQVQELCGDIGAEAWIIAFWRFSRKTLGMKYPKLGRDIVKTSAPAAGSAAALPAALRQLAVRGLDLGTCSRLEGSDLIVCVKVHARGGQFRLGQVVGGHLQVHVAAAPENGKATEELLRAMAKVFGVRAGAVSVIKGAFTPHKVIRMVGIC